MLKTASIIVLRKAVYIKKIEYAEAQINAYLMAIAKDEVTADDLTDKLKNISRAKKNSILYKNRN